MTDAEKAGLETVLTALGGKNARNDEYKKYNLETIRNSPVYELTKNYLIADGKAPITMSPVQMLSNDINSVCLYYYYFKPTTESNDGLFLSMASWLASLPSLGAVAPFSPALPVTLLLFQQNDFVPQTASSACQHGWPCSVSGCFQAC